MEITPSKRATLIYLLNNGAHVPNGISEATGYARETVSRGLSDLKEGGYVRSKGFGVWELTEAGQEKARELENRGFRKPE